MLSFLSESLLSFLTKNDGNMDPDFQLKVHFNANGVQRVQKLFLNRSVLTKAKLMAPLDKRFLTGGSLNTNHMTIYFRLCDHFLTNDVTSLVYAVDLK